MLFYNTKIIIEMKKFARIIELPETQCLLVVGQDEGEEGGYRVSITMEIDEVRASLGLGFHSEEKANHCMESFTKEQAEEFYSGMSKMIRP